ncbi:MAG: helix-turn-helix transcriptional regulator [Oceanospirillaceae bacterium]|nr:helix-turn-helix transcriptional regulator [Oceanospirillaceae bacterium]
MKPTPQYRSDCPINYALETFGDKWSLLIIRDLIFQGKKNYGEFLNAEEKISTNILANRLEKLELEGLISKSSDPDNHAKKVYRLSSKGIDLLPMLIEMMAWSAQYDQHTGCPVEFSNQLKADKQSLIAQLKQQLIKS